MKIEKRTAGGEIDIGIEEDVVVTAAGVERLHPRQDALLLIHAAK